MTKALPFLTLDKSYLWGCSAADLADLSTTHRLVLPEALVYEVVKDPTAERAKIFSKFPDTPNPYTVAHSVSKILQDELALSRPYSHENIAPRDLFNHKRLAAADFEIDSVMRDRIAGRKKQIEEDREAIIEISRKVRAKHPNAFSGKGSRQRMSALHERTFSPTQVREEYEAEMEQRPWAPKFDLLTPDWAHYRWFQMIGLFALDVAARHATEAECRASEDVTLRLEHDVLDFETMLTALAVGGDLAMREQKWIKMWNLLQPRGAIVVRRATKSPRAAENK